MLPTAIGLADLGASERDRRRGAATAGGGGVGSGRRRRRRVRRRVGCRRRVRRRVRCRRRVRARRTGRQRWLGVDCWEPGCSAGWAAAAVGGGRLEVGLALLGEPDLADVLEVGELGDQGGPSRAAIAAALGGGRRRRRPAPRSSRPAPPAGRRPRRPRRRRPAARPRRPASPTASKSASSIVAVEGGRRSGVVVRSIDRVDAVGAQDRGEGGAASAISYDVRSRRPSPRSCWRCRSTCRGPSRRQLRPCSVRRWPGRAVAPPGAAQRPPPPGRLVADPGARWLASASRARTEPTSVAFSRTAARASRTSCWVGVSSSAAATPVATPPTARVRARAAATPSARTVWPPWSSSDWPPHAALTSR